MSGGSVSILAGRRNATLLALVLTCTTVRAYAQTYVTAGWATTSREPGWYPSLATPSAQPASSVPSVMIGAGVWLPHNVGVEGSFTVYGAQSIPWHYNYLFGGNSDQLTTDRDLPLIGLVRFAPMRRHRVSLEPVVGGGVSFHRGASFRTADCGSGSRPAPCVPVTPRAPSDSLTTPDWLVTYGADLAVRVSSRVVVAPGFRISVLNRQVFLTGFDHRGPYSGGGDIWGVSVTGRYSIHRDDPTPRRH